MPVFLDGQQNLAALTVPGLYVDIILPSPMLVGTPTNIMGLVGVGSWGPLNSMIYCSRVTDATVSLGPPQNRKYDIVSHIEAATQVGSAIGFGCVRVSDGTDTAATGTVNPVSAVAATGSIAFTSNPTANQTITIGTSTVTFVTSGATGNQVNIGVNIGATLTALLNFLQGSADSQIVQCSYVLVSQTLQITDKTAGTAGNSFAIATNVTGATASGPTLTGGLGSTQGLNLTALYTGTQGNGLQFSIQSGSASGSFMAVVSFPGMPPEQFNNITGTGNALWVNIAAAINNGNASHGPSKFVTALAGLATTAPALSTPVGFTGGTDGATGVTDATLVGVDTLPRKGMYVMRGSLVTDFELVDHATYSQWAAITSFAISEAMNPVFATVSGDTIANAVTTLTSAGVDTPFGWLIVGDWPQFYDAYNGLTRQVSPAAFAIGLLGNLSPERSPLNKPLTGVVATQRSQLGLPYSDAELSLLNTSRLDVIVPPQNSSGGNYFSFGSGRNMSSNTGANGVEYTRMTNFLIRAARSNAAGSIVGKTQSIQPNDQTRAQAKALFDGFSAVLASPAIGGSTNLGGASGQGMIDGWSVVCDLTNNTPQTIALGYLFLYWQVRYLGIVRYFVVKFQGGSNVSVSVQNNAPSASQFSS